MLHRLLAKTFPQLYPKSYRKRVINTRVFGE